MKIARIEFDSGNEVGNKPTRTQLIQESWRKKFKEGMMEQWDSPDREPRICGVFGCAEKLTLTEWLSGDCCTMHSGANIAKYNALLQRPNPLTGGK